MTTQKRTRIRSKDGTFMVEAVPEKDETWSSTMFSTVRNSEASVKSIRNCVDYITVVTRDKQLWHEM